MELARLHWELQEYGEAVDCLERAVRDGLVSDELHSRLESHLAEASEIGVAPEVVHRIRTALEKVGSARDGDQGFEPGSPIATPTLARLLADQGHADKALAVAAGLLEQNPDDERALAVKAELGLASASRQQVIDELSRWLANARRLRQERVVT
jgi:tetratricopeptide (TPR) repeat protein